jgi:signal transduction histidine kinase
MGTTNISAQAAQAAEDAAAPPDKRIQQLEGALARVTELLRQTQEACMVWEQTFSSVSEPVAIISADYRVLRANAAYRRLLGDEMQLPERSTCFDAAAAPCEGCPLPEAVLSRRPGYVRHTHVVRGATPADDELCTLERWTYPIVNPDGTVDRVVEIVKDVTEEARLREAVGAAESLRQEDQFKAELLGTVSHELRSPLAAIQGYAETLLRHEKRLPAAERHEFLTAIQEAGDRLSAIVDRLLELSELDTGTYPLRLAPVDLVRTAREALAAIEAARLGQHPSPPRLALRLVDEAGQPVETLALVLGDARLLRDLLDQLLENAVKYSPEGGAITVGLCPVLVAAGLPSTTAQPSAAPMPHQGAPTRMIELTVQDQGMGIPAEHLPLVFERFHQVDSGLTRETSGMGLGLAICKRIAELHDGAIWAESTPGDGSVFRVLLPMALESE